MQKVQGSGQAPKTKVPAGKPTTPTAPKHVATLQAKNPWRVLLLECPATTTEGEVRALFPKKTVVVHVEKNAKGCICTVDFATLGEAEMAAKTTTLTLANQPLQVRLNGPIFPYLSPEQLALWAIANNCPPEVTEAELLRLVPGVQKVIMGRANSHRHFLMFATASKAQEALRRPSTSIRGQAIELVSASRDKAPRHLTVRIGNCPSGTKTEDLQALFPKARSISDRHHGQCYVNFATAEEAKAAASHPIQLQGTILQLKFLGQAPKRPHDGDADDAPPAKKRKEMAAVESLAREAAVSKGQGQGRGKGKGQSKGKGGKGRGKGGKGKGKGGKGGKGKGR